MKHFIDVHRNHSIAFVKVYILAYSAEIDYMEWIMETEYSCLVKVDTFLVSYHPLASMNPPYELKVLSYGQCLCTIVSAMLQAVNVCL